MKLLKLVVIIIVSLVLVACSTTGGGEELSYAGDQGVNWKFKKGKVIDERGVILSDPSRVRQNFGAFVKGFFIFCTDSEYNTLQTEYLQKNKCPAGFYQKYAKSMIVISDNINITNALKNIKENDKIYLSGNYLDLVGLFGPDGKKIPFKQSGQMKNYFIYADKISINSVIYQ